MPTVKSKIFETAHRMREYGQEEFFGTDKRNYYCFIITRFLYYACIALINGYRINITNCCKIYFAYESPRHLTKYEKPKYMFSPLIFDHMFSLVAEGKYMDNERFDFFIDPKLKKQFEEKLSTDAVYQFIRK